MRFHLDIEPLLRARADELTAQARASVPVTVARPRPRAPAQAEKHFCRICGAEREGPELIDTTALGSTFTTTPGRYTSPCPTPKCGEVCKICRRDIGDVHGPDCGPLMFTKLERPHIVDEGDCR